MLLQALHGVLIVNLQLHYATTVHTNIKITIECKT